MRKLIRLALVGLVLLALAGCATQPAKPRTIVKIEHVKSAPVIEYRTRDVTRIKRIYVSAGMTTPCDAAGQDEVYLPAMGGTQAGLFQVQCTVTFYPGIPASMGAFMRLTTIATPRFPQTVSDSYQLLQTENG